jgi:hypothetical protein
MLNPEILHLQYISEPKFDGTMINDLVMDDRRLKTLKAFTKSFSRINHTGEKLEKESWTADFVKGKGSGLTFLLHGSPGIGKNTFFRTHKCSKKRFTFVLLLLTGSHR